MCARLCVCIGRIKEDEEKRRIDYRFQNLLISGLNDHYSCPYCARVRFCSVIFFFVFQMSIGRAYIWCARERCFQEDIYWKSTSAPCIRRRKITVILAIDVRVFLFVLFQTPKCLQTPAHFSHSSEILSLQLNRREKNTHHTRHTNHMILKQTATTNNHSLTHSTHSNASLHHPLTHSHTRDKMKKKNIYIVKMKRKMVKILQKKRATIIIQIKSNHRHRSIFLRLIPNTHTRVRARNERRTESERKKLKGRMSKIKQK